MKIVIKTIPINEHRYPTLGDYWIDEEGTMQVRLALGLTKLATQALLLHELVEAFLCQNNGITFKQIDAFDKKFEQRSDVPENAEPGDDSRCPYRRQHRFAENLERMFALEAGLDWEHYVKQFDKLCVTLDDLVAGGIWPDVNRGARPKTDPCPGQSSTPSARRSPRKADY